MVQCCLCHVGFAEVKEKRGEGLIIPICVDCRCAMLHKEPVEDNG